MRSHSFSEKHKERRTDTATRTTYKIRDTCFLELGMPAAITHVRRLGKLSARRQRWSNRGWQLPQLCMVPHSTEVIKTPRTSVGIWDLLVHRCEHYFEMSWVFWHDERLDNKVECKFWGMVSSGLLRLVALVRTEVSEAPGSSFIRVTKIGELGTTQAANSNRLHKFWGFHGGDMKNVVFWDINTQFVPHRRHITSRLQSPTG
jgi:hypothetical protein